MPEDLHIYGGTLEDMWRWCYYQPTEVQRRWVAIGAHDYYTALAMRVDAYNHRNDPPPEPVEPEVTVPEPVPAMSPAATLYDRSPERAAAVRLARRQALGSR